MSSIHTASGTKRSGHRKNTLHTITFSAHPNGHAYIASNTHHVGEGMVQDHEYEINSKAGAHAHLEEHLPDLPESNSQDSGSENISEY